MFSHFSQPEGKYGLVMKMGIVRFLPREGTPLAIRFDKFIYDRSNAEFSHSICPECAKKLYPDLDIYDD